MILTVFLLFFLSTLNKEIIIIIPTRRQCAYASSGCDKKKIMLYRIFFRNLNFKNTVNFFLKDMLKLHKSPLLIANIIKSKPQV